MLKMSSDCIFEMVARVVRAALPLNQATAHIISHFFVQ